MRPAVIQFTKKVIIDGKTNNLDLNEIAQDIFDDIEAHAQPYRASNWTSIERMQGLFVTSTNENVTIAGQAYINRLDGHLPDIAVGDFQHLIKVQNVTGRVKECDLQQKST